MTSNNPVITDHDHVWQHRGRWRTSRCGACKEPISSHLSYGISISYKIGGDPWDYVHGEKPPLEDR
jgi:hypothetical protein